MNNRKIKFSGAAILAAALAIVVLTSCKNNSADPDTATAAPGDSESLSNIDYYTCTMHPSVRSKVPGKCPICGMDLVPVKKKSAASNAVSNEAAELPSEFSVPVQRQQQIGVTYASVEERPFQHTIRAVGLVASDKAKQWDFVSRTDGYIQKLSVFSPGEVVEKNAPVLTIYSPDLFTAEKEFVNALQMRDQAQSNNSPDVLNSAEQLVIASKERFRLWDITGQQIADLEKSRAPQENLTLHSPFKGIVENIGVEQGRKIMNGDRLVDIADLSAVWVWAQFYQDDLPMLKNGLPVTITISSSPDAKFNGTISLVDPFINDATRTARVRIDVENPEFRLRPDMYVDVELSMDMGKRLAVPAGAILPTGLHNIAFVDKGEGRLEPRFVELGPEYGDFYEVKSGLQKDERVVTSANFLIDAEAKVQGALKEW